MGCKSRAFIQSGQVILVLCFLSPLPQVCNRLRGTNARLESRLDELFKRNEVDAGLLEAE